MKRIDLIDTLTYFALGISFLGLGLLWGIFGNSGNHWLTPLSHIAGTVTALLFCASIKYRFSDWKFKRYQKHLGHNISIVTGDAATELLSDQHSSEFQEFMFKRYSYELFRNRASNLVFFVNRGIDAIGVIACLVFLIGPIYFWLERGADSSGEVEVIWVSVAFLVLSNVLQLCLSSLTEFIFGRWPGEARWAHQHIITAIQKIPNE